MAALDFLEQKSGHNLGAGTNEKITDGARGLYEKATGYFFASCKLKNQKLITLQANSQPQDLKLDIISPF